MKTIETKASIVIKDKGLLYNICTLTQTIDNDGDFSYVFTPKYQVIDLIPKGLFEGIQGLDLDLKKENYRREGIPTFISERVPPKNREELFKDLNKVGLDYYDPLQYLLKTKEQYFGDNLKIVRFIENQSIDIDYSIITNSYETIRNILSNIAVGNEVIINNKRINEKDYFDILYPIYLNFYSKKVLEQQKSVKNRTYKGRKPIQIKEDDFKQVLNMYNSKQMSLKEAISILGISRSTFIRRAKLCQK